jgi:hypothetical protein
LPRGHVRTAPAAAARPLARKQASLEAVRALAMQRRVALGAWLGALVGGAERVRLSVHAPAGDEAPRRWLDVARARHLGGGRDLAAVGFAIEAADGEAVVGDATQGVAAPDCWIERRTR